MLEARNLTVKLATPAGCVVPVNVFRCTSPPADGTRARNFVRPLSDSDIFPPVSSY